MDTEELTHPLDPPSPRQAPASKRPRVSTEISGNRAIPMGIAPARTGAPSNGAFLDPFRTGAGAGGGRGQVAVASRESRHVPRGGLQSRGGAAGHGGVGGGGGGGGGPPRAAGSKYNRLKCTLRRLTYRTIAPSFSQMAAVGSRAGHAVMPSGGTSCGQARRGI